MKYELSIGDDAGRGPDSVRSGLEQLLSSWASVFVAYTLAIAIAEGIFVFVGVLPGLICHVVLVAVLLAHQISFDDVEPGPTTYGLPVLALVSLLRILSITLPSKDLSDTYSFALIGLPLLVAICLAVRRTRLSWTAVGLGPAIWWHQLLIAVSGIPLGLIGYLALRPEAPVASLDWLGMTVTVLVLVLFVALTEELLFRGLILKLSVASFGGTGGLVGSSFLFAAMFLGTQSALHVAVMAGLGLFLSFCAHRTASLWGVLVCRGLILVGMMLVFPLVTVANLSGM